VIEAGAVLWDSQTCAVLECYSGLLRAGENPCFHVNRIPTHALADAPLGPIVWDRIADVVRRAEAICAYNAAFDRGFAEKPIGLALKRLNPNGPTLPWFCAMEDLAWTKTGRDTGHASLVARALAHGVQIGAAHRALDDCLILARLFERAEELLRFNGPDDAAPDFDSWLAAGVKRGQAPRVLVVSLAPFDQKEEVKEHGFRWNEPDAPKKWSRRMVADEIDAARFPFKVQVMR
jgi:DNA polymerase-3 subunit epsilon